MVKKCVLYSKFYGSYIHLWSQHQYIDIDIDINLFLSDVTKVGDFGDDVVTKHRLTPTYNLQRSIS